MLQRLRWTICLIVLMLPGPPVQSGPSAGAVPAFELKTDGPVITQTGQPYQYLDRIGRRAALLGLQGGPFEFWVWPWKVLRQFNVQFLTGASTQPVPARELLRDVTVTDAAAILNLVHEAFSVRMILTVPRDTPAALLLLDVHTTVPLTIVPEFLPVLQPQWPAGIGGQYSYWDQEMRAYLLSESRQRAVFYCGSPAAEAIAAPPAHMLADSPLQFKIQVPPGWNGEYIPLVMAGGPGLKREQARQLYRDLCEQPDRFCRETARYYQRLRERSLSVQTPDPLINQGFAWGQLALHNLLVDHPTLGTGLVAGYGLSGSGGRPGFAWFFGGDAFINCLALTASGDTDSARQALAFTQKWQRQANFPVRSTGPAGISPDEGKMAHELSMSEGLIDWWNDYHYGYNHADTTPWYLVAAGDYYRQTGDLRFIRESWPSLCKAFRWCQRKDSDGDGLLDLKGAGLGVLEFGQLVKIHNDLYTQGLWVRGLAEMQRMAAATGDREMELEAAGLLPRCRQALEKLYWMEDRGYYSFGAGEQGERVPDKSPYPAFIILLEQLDRDRSERTLEAIQASDLSTGWGIRSLSNQSSLYQPANYNYGAVWPFTSGFVSAAQFRHHYNLAALANLRRVLRHAFEYGPGVIPEVFSGGLNSKLAEGYHNQGFSVAGGMVALVRGLLGLDVDVPARTVTFAPKLPADWDRTVIRQVAAGDLRLDLELKRRERLLELTITPSGRGDCQFRFAPDLAPGAGPGAARLNGAPLPCRLLRHGQAWQAETVFTVEGPSTLTLEFQPVPELFELPDPAPAGAPDRQLKMIGQQLNGRALTVTLEGPAGQTGRLGLRCPEEVESVRGARLVPGILEVDFPAGPSPFVRHTVVLNLK